MQFRFSFHLAIVEDIQRAHRSHNRKTIMNTSYKWAKTENQNDWFHEEKSKKTVFCTLQSTDKRFFFYVKRLEMKWFTTIATAFAIASCLSNGFRKKKKEKTSE